MPFKKGDAKPPGSGRKKGVPNKFSGMEPRQIIEHVYNELGGLEAFTKWAAKKKDLFYGKIWTRLVPKAPDVAATPPGTPATPIKVPWKQAQ